MIFLYDNLIATMITAAVLLIVLTSMQRVTEVQIEQSATYMVKTQANNFSTWMEEDLLKMYENVPEDEIPVPFSNPEYNEDGLTTHFYFRQDSTDSEANEERRIRIRYRLIEAGTRTIGGEERSVYRLERATCDVDDDPDNCESDESSYWERDGGSSDLLSYFRVDMLDRDAQPVANPADVEGDPETAGTILNTRVRFAMVSPFETERQTLREVYYGATLILEL